MNEQQPVHLYREQGMTLAERIACHTPDHGTNTHVTEFGSRVTCPGCLALLRAPVDGDDVPPNPWEDE